MEVINGDLRDDESREVRRIDMVELMQGNGEKEEGISGGGGGEKYKGMEALKVARECVEKSSKVR